MTTSTPTVCGCGDSDCDSDALHFASRVLTHLCEAYEAEHGGRDRQMEVRAQRVYRLLQTAEAGCEARLNLQRDGVSTLAPAAALRVGSILVDSEGLGRVVLSLSTDYDGFIICEHQYEYANMMPSRPQPRSDRFAPASMFRVSALPARCTVEIAATGN